MLATRRNLLRYSSALAILPVLAACQTGSGGSTITVATISAYVQDILSGLTAIESSTVIRADLGAATTAQVDAALAQVENAVTALTAAGTSISLASGQSIVQQIQNGADTIIAAAQTIPQLPASAQPIILAIQVVLPILLSTVQLLATKAAPSSMTLDQAKAILANPKV